MKPTPLTSVPALPPAVTSTNDLRDIKPPVDIPSGWAWLWWTLGLLAVAALLFLAWRYWQKKREEPAKPEIVIPPHERARQRLQAALKLIHQPRPFCIEVSDAIRVYLEERFELHAPERTTEEFLLELQSSTLLTQDQKQTLGDFLGRCDLVKFARDEPEHYELEALHGVALRLVSETEPPPLPLVAYRDVTAELPPATMAES
jgi:hypothetical protein